MNSATFIQHMLNSLTLGSLYALVAIGYTMVYGILRLINFAHSEMFMLGAYFVFWGITLANLPWPVAMVIAIVVTAGVWGLYGWRLVSHVAAGDLKGQGFAADMGGLFVLGLVLIGLKMLVH